MTDEEKTKGRQGRRKGVTKDKEKTKGHLGNAAPRKRGRPKGSAGRPIGVMPGSIAGILSCLNVGDTAIVYAPDRSVTSVMHSSRHLEGKGFKTERGRFIATGSDTLLHCTAVTRTS